MADLDQNTQKLLAGLRAGRHELTNSTLRKAYRIVRVTPKARAEVADSLRRAGVEVLSDPATEPLIIRQPAKSVLKHRDRWLYAIAAIVGLIVVVGIATEDDDKPRPKSAAATVAATASATTTSSPSPSPEPTPSPASVRRRASAAVADDDYGEALAIIAVLGGDDERRVRRSISRRISYRARKLLYRGERTTARRLLTRAASYPSTPTYRTARAALRTADADAARVRAQARADARARRAAERAAAAATPEPVEPSTPDYDGLTCGEIGQSDIVVPPGSELDQDGDGVGCES